MDWASLKFYLSSLSEEQLKKPAKVYDPYFKRIILLEGLDSESSLFEGRPNDPTSPVILLASDKRE